MCYAKPGPRCSKHAKADYLKAQAGGNPEEIKSAKEAFARTPEGIKQLRAQGKDAVTDRYEADRAEAIALHDQYQSEVRKLKAEQEDWSRNRKTAPVNPDDLYTTANTDVGVPDGERISARRTKATDANRAARDFSAFADLPIAYGDKNAVQWTTMDEERSDFDYAKFTDVRNAETSALARTMGIHHSKPSNGFWSATADHHPDPNATNTAGVPTTWWTRMHSDSYGNQDMTEEETRAEEHYNTRELQNRTVAIVPREDAAIIRCETKEHYLNVVQRYYNPKIGSLDYQKMRKDGFDGFSVSTPVAKSGFPPAGTHPFEAKTLRGLSEWDGDSTVWFNKQSFDVVRPKQDTAHRMSDTDFGDLLAKLDNQKSTSKDHRKPKSEPVLGLDDDALAGLRKILTESPSETEARHYRDNPRPTDESLTDLRKHLVG